MATTHMPSNKPTVAICWLRRDLRLQDNTALYQALSQHTQVLPVFIFDPNILSLLPNKHDRRVGFIHQALQHMQQQLLPLGSSLQVMHQTPEQAFTALLQQYEVTAVYTNRDYEPYAHQRDQAIAQLLHQHQVPFYTFKDQVIMEPHEVLKDDGLPYTVFTPYSKKWRQVFQQSSLQPQPSEQYLHHIYQQTEQPIPTLQELGFEATEQDFYPPVLQHDIVKNYHLTRDLPAIQGTTRMSVHLRFGTISIRQLMADTLHVNNTYGNELIWREFYMMILAQFPHVAIGAFKPAYNHIQWRNNAQEFEAWCQGKTGFPIVDAGMRELNATGYMHNRVRMIVSSFLTKDLLIDWKWGEAYFAEKLLDFDLSANNGGWQWAAGSGCDAAPYFRVFNPDLQTQKFDPKLVYINKWIPELNSLTYPRPIVDHKMARERCLAVYKQGLGATQ